jgi:vacuolar-type H+-ATPase subunit I/STV1
LTGTYRHHEYGEVILTPTVIRHFDCILAATKEVVLKNKELVGDTPLRDTENVPLKEAIEQYFKREVLPFAKDAWLDKSKTKVGYEIPFTRYFYKYTPPVPAKDLIDKKCTKIDDSITQKETLIQKLTQYKKSLIYNV